MALQVTVQGAEGTVSEAVQQQAVTVGAPSVAVSFSEQELAIEVTGGGVQVGLTAPGIANGPPGEDGEPGPPGEAGPVGETGPPGTTLHSELTDVSANQHHNQAHAIDGADHSASGLEPGYFLKATGETEFGFAPHGLSYSDVGAAAAAHNHAGSALGALGNPVTIAYVNRWQWHPFAYLYNNEGQITLVADDLFIRSGLFDMQADTKEGEDTDTIRIAGGGAANRGRGAFIGWYGNQVGPNHGGTLWLSAGDSDQGGTYSDQVVVVADALVPSEAGIALGTVALPWASVSANALTLTDFGGFLKATAGVVSAVAPYLNDLEDVEASPEAGSLLEYDAEDERWIAGHRLIFRPALKVYMISEPGG